MKILIAEDDPVSMLLLERVLRNLGHDVVKAADGDEALQTFQTLAPDVIVSDWLMPGLSGPDLLQRIRGVHREKYSYAILLTTLSGKNHMVQALDAGADDFMTKPLDAEQIRARLAVAERVLALQYKLPKLPAMMSVCSWCDRLRDGRDWLPASKWITKHTDSELSNGICDGCLERNFPPSP